MVAPSGRAGPPRIDSLDLLRGLVIVLMALDHVRGFWSAAAFDPTDIERTTPALFATRWVTHLCAPTFVLLVGVGAYLSSARPRGLTRPALARFLVARGVWLILLEWTVVKLGWQLTAFDIHLTGLGVLWAIGWSMIALAALIHLPLGAIAAISIALVAGHDALDGISPHQLGALDGLWKVLHAPGRLRIGDLDLVVQYPLVPWMGVAGLGYLLGALLSRPQIRDDPQRRVRVLLAIGGAVFALFLVLRGLDLYGDPSPWRVWDSPAGTVMSFSNVTKYPPSLLFLCATLGLAIGMLASCERWRGPAAKVLVTFGRVPMFFYILHLPLIHGAANIASGSERMFSTEPWGLGLWGVYVVWLCVVAALYPACRWFAGVKTRNPAWWLRYL